MARLFRKRGIYYAWGWLEDGTRWTVSTRTRNRRAADAEARRLEREAAERQRQAAHQAGSIAGVLDDYLAWSQSVGRARGTVLNIAGRGAHVVRILGGQMPAEAMRLPDGLQHARRYVASRSAEGAALYTIALEVSILRAALRHAGIDVRGIVPRELSRAYKPRTRWLSQAEAAALILAVEPRWREHVIAYLYTGARRSELLAVRAADVRLPENLLHLPGKKTTKADRWIPIAPPLRPILERRLRERSGWTLFEPCAHPDQILKRACIRAKIPHASTTDLRRTFASHLLNAGTSTSVAKDLMGHTTTRQLDLVYGHIADEARQRAVAVLSFTGGKQGGSTRLAKGGTGATNGTGSRPKTRR